MKSNNIVTKIESNLNKIIIKWIKSKPIEEIINTYTLDKNLIQKEHAVSIFKYYIDYNHNDKENTLDHSLTKFLIYLKKNDLKQNDLFIGFSTFKNIMLEYIIKEGVETFDEINKFEIKHQTIFNEILIRYEKIEPNLTKSIDIIDKYVLTVKMNKEGLISSISSAYRELSGYNDDLIGTSYKNLLHEDNLDEIYEDITKTINSGNIWIGELKNLKKSGEIFWVKTTIHPNFDNIGKIIGFDAIYKDITSQIELKNHQNILIEQSKSAEMGEMISMIAHQWRQPLQAVSILVQKLSLLKLLDGDITDEVLEEVVSQVLAQLDYMSKTIDDFRDYFKPNKEKQKVLIDKVVQKSLDFLDYLFKLNMIEVNYINNSNSEICLYLNEMVQVLINLSKNSCDAMNDKNIENRFINIKTYEDNLNIIIELEDNAGGISKDIINKIFDPYFSTKGNKKGTGLGLYMSKQIVQIHLKGDISVENTKTGSRFTIKLPLK